MSDANQLMNHLKRELATVPLEHWGFFFPAQVAVWRYMAERAPNLLGEFEGGFDGEPYFTARGSEWFLNLWAEKTEFWDALDRIMMAVAKAIPKKAVERGFLRCEELPPISMNDVAALAELIEREVARAAGGAP